MPDFGSFSYFFDSPTETGEDYFKRLREAVCGYWGTMIAHRAGGVKLRTAFAQDQPGPLPLFADATRRLRKWMRAHELGLSNIIPFAEGTDLETCDWKLLEAIERPLSHRAHAYRHADECLRITKCLIEYLGETFAAIDHAATRDDPRDTPFTVLAYELLPDPQKTLNDVFELFMDFGRLGHFVLTRELSYRLIRNHGNMCREYHLPTYQTGPFKFDIPVKKLITGYLADTPLLDFFMTEVPVRWDTAVRLSHTHVLGRTMSGKTTLIERLVMHDAFALPERSIIVMSPHGDLIKKLVSLARRFDERVILIDASDHAHPPAINPFAVRGRRLTANNVLKSFEYILSSLGLELTPKQRTLWSYTIRMFLTMPQSSRKRNATILDLKEFMLRPETFADLVALLPDYDRQFFNESVFPSRSIFASTREEIGHRLDHMLADPYVRTLLSAPETKVDFFNELNRGSIILIDTAKRTLSDSSSLFGGMMLALIFQAMFARDDMPERERRPTFVYIDEMQNYMTRDISEMLVELRKFGCGLVLAHHTLSQAQNAELAATLVSQPGVKLLVPSAKDAPSFTKETHTSLDFFENLPPYHFGLYIEGVTPRAAAVKVVPVVDVPLSLPQQEVFLRRNHERTSFGTARQEEHAAGEPTIPASPHTLADEDVDEW